MLKYSLAFFTLLLLGCGGQERQSETKSTNTAVLPKKDETPKYIWLKEDNAEEILLDYFQKNKERKFRISTKFGNIDIQLYDNTPLHTGNFLYLVKEKDYFDGTVFYRTKPEFIIQGGNSENERIEERRFEIGTYSLKAEFNTDNYHKRGAVAMSRNYGNNPEKRSTPYDFYIVVGKPHSDYVLYTHQREKEFTFPKEHFKTYQTLGGTPHLDQEHTVFGEVVAGMDVVDKISKLETDKSEWPKEDVVMDIHILK